MTPDIFLSYTREDQTAAQRFAEAFEAQGFSVWWDVTLRSGEAYDQVTEEALRTARAVVVLWSKMSVASRWVRAEATLADRNRTLVPARIEACDLPIMFELTQTADLSGWTGEAAYPTWRAFLADVRRFIEAGSPARPLAPGPSTQAAPSPPHSTRPTLAILPFINRSEVEKDEVFALGMVEDLTAALSFSPWMDVLASGATAIYRTGARDLRQIGRDLGVRYLLEGNVRRMGDNLRVSAQLVEAETGKILWTQKFDRPLVELVALQEDLVTEVAAHLGVQVERAEMEHALKKPGDLSAWEAFMRAQSLVLGGAPPSRWQDAVAELERAVAIDPGYGPAHAFLASYRGRLLLDRGGDDPQLARQIVEHIRRARALDPNNPMVLGASAAALLCLGRLQDALPLAERAVQINPSHQPASLSLGAVLMRLGRSDEAIAELDRTERGGPDSSYARMASVYRSVAHLRAGRLDQALDDAERSLRLFPSTEALIQNMLCMAKSGSWDSACNALRLARDTDPDMSLASVENQIRACYTGSDAVDEYVALARRLWDEAAGEPGCA
jgi:TolB-like protein/Flp pilus assembly protein TadD